MKPIMSDDSLRIIRRLYLIEDAFTNIMMVTEYSNFDFAKVIGEAEAIIDFKLYDLEAMSEQAKEVERVKLEAEIEERQKRLQELSK